MSLGLHRRWKRRVVELADLRPEHTVLDLAAGTGDLALAIAGRGWSGASEDSPRGVSPRLVVAADLTSRMMQIGRRRPGAQRVVWVSCDAQSLPFRDASLDRVVIGYGLRNFPDLSRSLVEIHRCLAPGGRVVALDFGKPHWAPFRRAYLAYLDISTRAVGWILHRDPEAYAYIPESLRLYPAQDEVLELMQRAGFARAGYVDLLAGAMAINFGDRAE